MKMNNPLFPPMKTFYFFVTGLVMLAGPVLLAQFPDGTVTTPEWVEVIKTNLDKEEKTTFYDAQDLHPTRLGIVAYVIPDDSGYANCSEADIANGISTLNGYFSAINLSFQLQSVQYVNDYNYSRIEKTSDTEELLKKHHTQDFINLYLMESIAIDSINRYGLTFFPDDTLSNQIFLDKQFIQGNYLTTLMGHFFGLLSTHDTLGGIGLADESNCRISGDFLCDTWADPNLSGKVNASCEYMDAVLDANNEFYKPSVANLMSESYDACKCILTPGQYRRMRYYLNNFRNYLR
jgi:hypothetical protein